nr:serine hydrolase [Asaia astilbis]
MKFPTLAASLWASACLAIMTAPSAHADDLDSKIEASFAPMVAQYQIPGLVIGVTRNGVHHFYSTGLASRADKRPATPDTLFELGSMSKIFTVTLAALAVERGKITLNDTVAHHLCDDHCVIGSDLTLLDLATHHSGGLPLQVPENISNIGDLTRWLQSWHPPMPARAATPISVSASSGSSRPNLSVSPTLRRSRQFSFLLSVSRIAGSTFQNATWARTPMVMIERRMRPSACIPEFSPTKLMA